MQSQNRFLDDLAKMANGALATFVGVKDEIQAMVRQQVERMMASVDTVPREEFEAVKAMAAKARSEQERLEKRVAALEAKLDVRAPAASPAKKRNTAAANARTARSLAKSRRGKRR